MQTTYIVHISSKSAYRVKNHVQKEHHKRNTVSVQTNINNYDLEELSSIKVKQEQIEKALHATLPMAYAVKNENVPPPNSPPFSLKLPRDNPNS